VDKHIDTVEDTRCSRCGRQVSQLTEEFVGGEAIGDGDDVVCPHCLTVEDQAVIDEAWMETSSAASHCSRCGVDRPEDWGEWLIVDEGCICPSCYSPVERKAYEINLQRGLQRWLPEGARLLAALRNSAEVVEPPAEGEETP
jgi:DNA-directed RNA polymerase subunit RPC12/RpoP